MQEWFVDAFMTSVLNASCTNGQYDIQPVAMYKESMIW